MSGRRGIIVLVIALAFLALVLVLRRAAYNDAVDPKYHAALYFAHIRAIDEETSEPVGFEIKWDYESITPYFKGSGPSVIETHADKSVTVALVGESLEVGLSVSVAAEGYHREVIRIDPDEGGILTTDSSKFMTEVKLRRRK